MSAGPRRLALRIYLVSAAAVLAAALAIGVVFAVAWRPPRRGGPAAEAGRYLARQVALRWPDQARLQEELRAAHAELRMAASAYRWDGRLLASATPAPLPPLSPAERDALARAGELERGGACRPDRCQLAFALADAAGPHGYLVVERLAPHREPPPFAVLPPLVVLVGLGVAALLLGRGLARPLARLAATARALGAGDLRARTGLTRRDELGDVARAFDEMAGRVETLLRAQTELLANVAHELRTPLARIRVALDLAGEGDAAVARESLAEIAADLSELEGLVSDILASARMDLARNTASLGGPPLHLGLLDVAQLCDGAAERLRQRHPGRQLDLELSPELPAVVADPVLLRRALDNLLDNARKYSAPEAPIRLRAAPAGGGVVLEVIDRGEGLAPGDLQRLFTPFFRGDRSRARATGGVGLGLSLARRIVEAHGGTLTAASVRGQGTTMTIALPLEPALPAPAPPPAG